jgi:hypothetical protein
MAGAQEGIEEALRQLLESARALVHAMQPFVEEGVSFTPRRSEVVEALFREFDRAKDGYHEALRRVDQSDPHQIED